MNKKTQIEEFFAGIIAIFILALIILIPCFIIDFFKAGTITEFTDIVDDKWIKMSGSDTQKYLISTENYGVFENVDDWNIFAGIFKFDSSDFYAKIKIGKTYRFKVMGWRIGFFSSYKNIVEFEEI